MKKTMLLISSLFMFLAVQCRRLQAGQMGQITRQLAGWCRLLGGITRNKCPRVAFSAPGQLCASTFDTIKRTGLKIEGCKD